MQLPPLVTPRSEIEQRCGDTDETPDRADKGHARIVRRLQAGWGVEGECTWTQCSGIRLRRACSKVA